MVEIACSVDYDNSWTKPNFLGLQKKFNTLYKLYNEDKLANEILESDCHACKFYGFFYRWWHQTRIVMKHVITSANNSVSVEYSTTNNGNDLC